MKDELTKMLLDETESVVNEFKDKFQGVLISKRGLKGSSIALNDLTIVRNDNSKYVGLAGVDYIYWVIHGRGPGRFPPPYPDGTWPLPFQAAKELALHGNIAKMKPTADAYDVAFDEMVEKINKKVGDTALAFILKTNAIY